MRLLFNFILVVIGIPLLGTTFTLIAGFFPISATEFTWTSRGFIFTTWLVFLVLFIFIYRKRTQWLENVGIFRSLSNFKAYMIENHGYPEVAEMERIEFVDWANLPEERPSENIPTAEDIYKKIHIEFKSGKISDEKRRAYIKSLAWYMPGWPLHDEDDF